MFDMSIARVLATLVAVATLGLAMVLANGIPPGPGALVRALGPILFGAALAQWLMFPLFARRDGGAGVLQDVALWLLMVGLTGLLAGTLVSPGAGTVLGPLVTLWLPVQSPLAALVYALGAALGLVLIRRRRPASG